MIRAQARLRSERALRRTTGRPIGAIDRHGKAHRVTEAALARRSHELADGIAARLEQAMAGMDVSASELAAALDCADDSVYGWTSGRMTPSLWTLIAIALALKCSLLDLFPEAAHYQ